MEYFFFLSLFIEDRSIRRRNLMKDNMLVFNDNETHTEIRYVIAHFEKSRWYHYLDFPNIDDAKEHLEKIRKIHPNMKFGIFEKIEQATINMLNEEFI